MLYETPPLNPAILRLQMQRCWWCVVDRLPGSGVEGVADKSVLALRTE
jgi:hypothetical protein